MDGLNELLGVVAHDAFIEGSRVCHIVEELATVDKLADNICDLDFLSGLLMPDGILIELEILHDVTVVQGLHRLHLVAEQLEGALVELWVVETEYLNGVLGAILDRGEFNLGAEAGTEGSSKLVLSNIGCHVLVLVVL
jgi:hypothetical protein